MHDGSGLTLRFDGDKDHERRNPHMRGTTLALRTIFGLSGSDHASEFLDVRGEQVHMFDCFALVNRLLLRRPCRGDIHRGPNQDHVQQLRAPFRRHP